MAFTIKTRGKARAIAREFLCPEHGRFTVDVAGEPDPQPCPRRGCGRKECEFVMSKTGKAKVKSAEVVRGKWQKPERKTWLDTRELGEGMDKNDWLDKRAEIRDEERRSKLKELIDS